jgi:D-aminopeptidase
MSRLFFAPSDGDPELFLILTFILAHVSLLHSGVFLSVGSCYGTWQGLTPCDMTKIIFALIASLPFLSVAANSDKSRACAQDKFSRTNPSRGGLAAASLSSGGPSGTRHRASDLGLKIGVLPVGPLDTITDVAGVEVGHTTINRGNELHTGVTAVLPHSGNLYREKVPGAVFVGNGFGKLAGFTQVEELGEIETPILLTSTLSVPRVADALISYMLALPSNEHVLSINPIVGETNDGYLSDIRGRHIAADDVVASIKNAKGGLVDEGAVGAGAGTVAFGWKGGIGTASRHLPAKLGGYTVGVLVQTNFGGVLTIAGVPVGQELGQYYLRDELQQQGGESHRANPVAGIYSSRHNLVKADDRRIVVAGVDAGQKRLKQPPPSGSDHGDGSVMVVVATDAPLDARNLKRLGARALLGVARTGSAASNGSGDYAIAFSTAPQVRIHTEDKAPTHHVELLTNDAISPLFFAAIEATEEAVYNSLFRATTTTGQGHTVQALPIDKTTEILKRHGAIR